MFHLDGPIGSKRAVGAAWRRDEGLLTAWKTGNTGYPFIDAAMRELRHTGFLSNRWGWVLFADESKSYLAPSLIPDVELGRWLGRS